MRIRFLTLPVLLAVSMVTASVNAEVEFLGFSEDGSHAAMLEHWFNDGSGSPSARLVVAATGNGEVVYSDDLIWPEYLMWELEGTDIWCEGKYNPARDSVLAVAGPILDSLRIGRWEGVRHCVNHPITDRGVDPDMAVFVEWAMSPAYMSPEMTLEITEDLWEPEHLPEWYDMVPPPVLLTMTVTGAEGESLFTRRDSRRPEDVETYAQDRFVSDYRIRDVYLMGSAIAVVLDAVEPGFEGSDGMFRLVAGTLGD